MNNTVNVNETTGFNPQTGEFGRIPQIIIFEADKYSVSDLTPVLISWQIEESEIVKLDDELVDSVGSKSISILSPQSLNLKATNSFGFIEKQINISIEHIIPVINRFSVSRIIIAEGQSVEIKYAVEKALRVELNGLTVNTNGNKIEVTPNRSTIYQLIAFSLTNEVKSEFINVEVIPMPKVEVTFPSPNFTISFNRRAVGTQLPDFNLMFPIETSKFTKIDEKLLKSENGFEVEHTLRKRILKALGNTFVIVSIITISVVFGYYYGLTSNHL